MVSSKLDTALAIRLHELSTADPDAGRTRVQVLVHVVGDLAAVERAGLWTEWIAGPVAGGTIALGDLEQVASLDDVGSIEAPRPARPMIHDSVPAMRADVARQIPPGFSGRGVLLGVVDTGIDIFHGAFRKPDGTTRVASLLDLTMRQTISITGNPTGGTVELEWRAPAQPGSAANPIERTTPIQLPATAAQVQAALEALPTINPGDIVVTGGPLPTTPIVLDFIGRYSPDKFDTVVGLSGFRTVMDPGAKMLVTLGREFTQDEINAALSSPGQQFLSRDKIGHGTHVMGTAAGDGSQSGTNETDDCHKKGYYVGVAPEADLAMVRMLDTNDIVRGVTHLLTQAWRPAGTPVKPAVVNLSVGTSVGPHDGTDNMELALDGLLTGTTGRAVVVSASNDGELYDHAHPELHPQAGGGVHGLKTVAANGQATFQFVIAANDRNGDQFELWYSGAGRLSVNLTTPAPAGASLPVPVPAGAGTQQLPLAGHQVTIASDLNNGSNGKHHIGIVLKPPAAGTVVTGTWTITLRETAGTATPVDCWIIFEASDPHPRFINADQDRTRTVATPGTARNVITVGAYDASSGKLGEFSSRGPTTDNRTKPDLAAPGVGITSARSNARNTGCKCDCCFEFYKVESGTSSAAPHVTGVVALMLQASPNLSFSDIKTKLAASHFPPDPNTGALPNNEWGAGKLDAEKAVRAALPAPQAASPDPTGPAEPLVLPAAAYPAAHLPLPARIGELRRRIGTGAAGQMLAALVSEHVDEVLRLINTDRRVIVAWHRMDGPVLLRVVLGDVHRDVVVPATLAGRPVVPGLARLLDALALAGSPALRSAIVTHRGLLLAVPGARLPDLDNQLRAS